MRVINAIMTKVSPLMLPITLQHPLVLFTKLMLMLVLPIRLMMSTSMMHEFMVLVGMIRAIKAKIEALMSSKTLPQPLGVVHRVGDDDGVGHHVNEVNLPYDGGGDGKCN